MSFPGCCIPAVSAIIAGMAQSRLELQHFDNIGEHYALTLRMSPLRYETVFSTLSDSTGEQVAGVRTSTGTFRRSRRFQVQR